MMHSMYGMSSKPAELSLYSIKESCCKRAYFRNAFMMAVVYYNESTMKTKPCKQLTYMMKLTDFICDLPRAILSISVPNDSSYLL